MSTFITCIPLNMPVNHIPVDTTANDQVYRGYGFTKRAPNIAAAVEAAAGR